jgi:phosphate starvation-inducible PhoH-like protein
LILRHAFTPSNNTRLTNLCGPVDSHLRTIEIGTQTKIAHRHEHFKVEGTKTNAMRAMEILQAIYEMAARPISQDKVQLMLAEDLGSHTDVWVGALRPKGTRKVATQTLINPHTQDVPTLLTKRADLKARSTNQAHYLDSIAQHDITFGIGPAGTGKTYLAVACAVDALERASVQRIILTRPAVEAGEKLGFLPGDLGQKVDPYLRPLYDALYDLMGFDKVQKAFDRQTLEIAPLAFMRGRTLNHAFVILDEAQNTTPEQMKMFLTRMGFGTKAVVTGDVSQIDLPKGHPSGLIDAERVLRRVEGIGFAHLTSKDVVQSSRSNGW